MNQASLELSKKFSKQLLPCGLGGELWAQTVVEFEQKSEFFADVTSC